MTTPSVSSTRVALRADPPAGGAISAEPVGVPGPDAVVESVARGLRGARARTGMSEDQVVAVLAEQGFATTAARLRGWERTGVIRIDAASRLADVYGTTLDALAGRRSYRSLP